MASHRGLAMVGYAMVDGEAVVRLVLVNAQVGEPELKLLFENLCEVAAELREGVLASS
jgi:hypothetical protein